MTRRALVLLLASALRDLPGDAVAIGAAVDGVSEFACRGHLDGAPVQMSTVFYGASITKQIIGVAAARASLGGLLDPEDPVARWLPDLEAPMSGVRLQHLIHHTSGLPDVADPAAGVPGSNADLLQRFQHSTGPSHRPGERFAYNNAGYVVLAEAVARSMDLPIEAVVGELFRHLSLPNARVGGTGVRLDGRPDPPGTVGDGGLWISVQDLTRWLQGRNAAAFGADIQQRVETTATLADGTPLDYAWGVRVTHAPAGRIITHGGSWDRWLGKTVRIPEKRIAVAVLSTGAAELAVSRTGTNLATAIASG